MSSSTTGAQPDLLVRGGRVLDPASGLDGVQDVAVRDGVITAIGPELPAVPGTREVDARGHLVVPGLVDIHMHAYGGIGFADSDTVGVGSGVTALVDAGGAGAWSFPDFVAQLGGRLRTDLYSWLYIGPSGIAVSIAVEDIPKDMGSVVPTIPLADLLEMVERHRAMIAGLKVPAYGPLGEIGPMTLSKGLARTLGLPLYIHVGDIQENQPLPLDMDAVIDLLDPQDTITHCYSPNPNSLFRPDGTLYPSITAAVERGVGFDVGMGAFNFDFRIARRGMDVGFLPTTISSDLQQANVTGPTHSLVHVMSMFLALGMSLPDVITATTSAAAARIGQADRHGALRVGRAADITLLDLTDRDVVFADTVGGRLPGDRVLEVVLTVKDGVVVTPQPEAAAAEENWSNYMALQEDAPPEAARTYDQVRRNLLGDVAARLEAVGEWALLPVQTAVGEVLAASELGRGEAGRAVLGAFLDPVFPQAPGFFLALQERSFVLDRLRALARG